MLFGNHSWDSGFSRVGCVLAMLIDRSVAESFSKIRARIASRFGSTFDEKSIENQLRMCFSTELGFEIDLGGVLGSILSAAACRRLSFLPVCLFRASFPACFCLIVGAQGASYRTRGPFGAPSSAFPARVFRPRFPPALSVHLGQ